MLGNVRIVLADRDRAKNKRYTEGNTLVAFGVNPPLPLQSHPFRQTILPGGCRLSREITLQNPLPSGAFLYQRAFGNLFLRVEARQIQRLDAWLRG